LNEALRLAPESLRVRMDLSNLLLVSNLPKEALGVLDGADTRQKRSLAYVTARNWVLIALGDQNEARKGANAALAVSKHPDVLLQDAILRLAAGDVSGARAPLEQILKTNPNDIRALSTLVESYVMQKQVAAATERIRRHVAQNPGSAPLQMFWANWLLENGQKTEARQALSTAKSTAPDNNVPDLILARLDFDQGNLDRARQRLQTLLAAGDRNPQTHLLLATVEDADRNYDKAIEHYRRVVDTDDRNALALNNLAFALSRDTALLDDAMKYAQRARELEPESSYIQDTLGWIYYRKGLYPLAAKELERALAKSDRPSIRFHLGLAYRKLGDLDKSRRLMTTALAADPKLADTDIVP
jgi:Tfp pilus assembly protein PilF